jgi:hypothetical protein
VAQQQIPAHERHAIWTVYGKRCYMCREPVALLQARLDHIIPEAMADKPDALRALLARLGLAADFDVRSHDNIACICDRCNALKGGKILADGWLVAQLHSAADKARRIRGLLQARRLKDSRELLDYHLAAARRYESEMKGLAALGRLNQTYLEKLRLITVDDLTIGKIDELRNTPLWEHEGMGLTNRAGETRFARTCAEYKQACEAGFSPDTTIEMKVADELFETFGAILDVLERSKPAMLSYIDEPRVGVADVAFLPASLIGFGNTASTIDNLIRDGRATITGVGSDLITITLIECLNTGMTNWPK